MREADKGKVPTIVRRPLLRQPLPILLLRGPYVPGLPAEAQVGLGAACEGAVMREVLRGVSMVSVVGAVRGELLVLVFHGDGVCDGENVAKENAVVPTPKVRLADLCGHGRRGEP